jgi:hypothetical protein
MLLGKMGSGIMRAKLLAGAAFSSLILSGAAVALDVEYDSNIQKNLAQIGVTADLHNTLDGAGVGVAILDGYANPLHPDLVGKIISEILYAGSFASYDFHGTHVSGIAGASRDDNGIVGVAPGSTIYNFPVFDDNGWVASDLGASILNRITALNASGEQIVSVNMSYGPVSSGDVFLSGELNLFDNYKDDFVIVRAAGNSGVNARSESYSGTASTDLSHVLIVGSVDANNVISSFSNKPGSACISSSKRCASSEKMRNFWIVAPGEMVPSGGEDGAWYYASGTSMAAPHVAGAVAIVQQDALLKSTPLTPTDVTSILKRSATDLGTSGVDSVYGWGLLNLPAALAPVGEPDAPTGETVDSPKSNNGGGRNKRTSRSSRTRFFDDSVLQGMIVLDDFGRPFEAADFGETEGAVGEPGAHIGTLSSVVLSRPVAETKTAGFRSLAWSSHESSTQPSQSYQFVSEDLELRLAYGTPKVAFALSQSIDAQNARPQSLDQMMFAAMDGNVERIFDRAASFYMKKPLSAKWDMSSFMMYSLNHIEYVPGFDAAIPHLWGDAQASFAGLGFDRKIDDRWSLGLTYTALRETGTIGGLAYTGAFAFGDSALTQTAGLKLSAQISDRFSISGFYAYGFVNGLGSADSIFQNANWRGDQFGLGFSAIDLAKDGDSLQFSVSKAFAATDGVVTANVPVGRELDGRINYDLRSIALNGSQMPVNMEMRYSISFGDLRGTLALDMMNEDIHSLAGTRFGIMSGFTYAF